MLFPFLLQTPGTMFSTSVLLGGTRSGHRHRRGERGSRRTPAPGWRWTQPTRCAAGLPGCHRFCIHGASRRSVARRGLRLATTPTARASCGINSRPAPRAQWRWGRASAAGAILVHGGRNIRAERVGEWRQLGNGVVLLSTNAHRSCWSGREPAPKTLPRCSRRLRAGTGARAHLARCGPRRAGANRDGWPAPAKSERHDAVLRRSRSGPPAGSRWGPITGACCT